MPPRKAFRRIHFTDVFETRPEFRCVTCSKNLPNWSMECAEHSVMQYKEWQRMEHVKNSIEVGLERFPRHTREDMVISTDVSHSGKFCIGVCFRDGELKFLHNLAKYYDGSTPYTSMNAEALGVYVGLEKGLELVGDEYKRIQIYTDLKPVRDAYYTGKMKYRFGTLNIDIINDIRRLAGQPLWASEGVFQQGGSPIPPCKVEVYIHYIHRETNQAADFISRSWSSWDTHVQYANMGPILEADKKFTRFYEVKK